MLQSRPDASFACQRETVEPQACSGLQMDVLGHGLCNWQATVVAASGALMFSVKYECMYVCFGIV